MTKINLHEEFVKELNKKIPNRSELTDAISDILRIEREPASRRLSEKVQFSVREMGILSKALGISIDSLLHGESHYHWLPVILESPLGNYSMDTICDTVIDVLSDMREITKSPSEYSAIIHTLPLEYYANYPHLMKFMFFKWGQYRVGTEEFESFQNWRLPSKLENIYTVVKPLINEISHTTCIWDDSLIWTFMREMIYFHKMNILNNEDLNIIKSELKDLLTRLERHLKGTAKLEIYSQDLNFYISNINLGVTCWYLFSEKRQLSSFNSHFTSSTTNNIYGGHLRIKNWIDSFKNVSVMISGCGELERRRFFNKQHEIIDYYID